MIFVIEYDRRRGQLVQILKFSQANRRAAEEARFNLDLAVSRGKIEHEVALLEAESEAALRKTHRRYFESLEELAAPATE